MNKYNKNKSTSKRSGASRYNKNKTKGRGGASLPCPRCHGNSRVLRTTRGSNGALVLRERICVKKKCSEKFHTVEMRSNYVHGKDLK